ncbi:MAG: diaminopropionate ammonia-lyase [Chloroflexaceae bacterium]
MRPTRIFHNPHARPVAASPLVSAALAFHQRLPGYAPTPLIELPDLAHALGIGRLWLKNESERLGLPSFKILGAAWATYCALVARLGREPTWSTLDELADQLAPLRPLSLAAATDGNHGRAVARMARLLGLEAHIFVPHGTAPARIAAITGEGAEITIVEGSYDEAVARSARLAGPRCLVISDTSWAGYEETPRQVIAGYGTIFAEVDAALAARSEPPPDVVVIQMGVGALAAAAVGHYRRPDHPAPPRLIGVEPDSAACVLASLRANRLTAVPGPHTSIMAGLNCDTPSLIAWPLLRSGLDVTLAIDDRYACQAVRTLAAAGIAAGETGAAGLGGLLALHELPGQALAAGLRPGARVLLLSTEGVTDPEARARILAANCARDCDARRACVAGR